MVSVPSGSTSVAAAAAAAARVGSSTSSQASGDFRTTPLWDMDDAQLNFWMKSIHALFPKVPDPNKLHLAAHLWKNVQTALKATVLVELKRNKNGEKQEEEASSPPPSKRSKLLLPPRRFKVDDPYKIWVHLTPEDGDDSNEDVIVYDESEVPSNAGGKIAQLNVAGWMNALAGQPGGVVAAKAIHKLKEPNKAIPTALNATMVQLKGYAVSLHRAVQTRLETDVLTTTPQRIQTMLAPDLSPAEFKGVRKRIYDTVVLGKGLHVDEEDDDVPVAAQQGVHDIEKFKKCHVCGNNDQSSFVLDRKNGDVICSNCGTVVFESIMHEGSQFRKFEGEVDRNHHGDAQNPLMSNAHNMSTTLGGVQVTSGAGLGGFGSQSKKSGLETVLRNAHAFTELNISQFGKGDRRTRTGYKDRQKKDAFLQMTHVGDALNLHEAVVQRAKELFAGFRDDRELVQQFKPVIAACLCEAFDQLSQAGRQILKQKEQQQEETSSDAQGASVINNARANRRNELHHASMAGRGGLQLDFSTVDTEEEKAPLNEVEKKLASTWDLDDCRSWLLTASRSIAQKWQEERASGSKKIPEGSQDELEGKLVEHTITICDHLEAELKSRDASTRGKRVVTPRVQSMAKLGIKWQHDHERGSGGKGGVGNNARMAKKIDSSGKKAGQILIMKTANKLSSILKDHLAGEAIHRELRALVGRQEARKLKERRDEAARQRFQQMKRKPWLLARAEVET